MENAGSQTSTPPTTPETLTTSRPDDILVSTISTPPTDAEHYVNNIRVDLDVTSVRINGFRITLPTTPEALSRILKADARAETGGKYAWDQLGITAGQGQTLDSIDSIEIWFEDPNSRLPWGLQREFQGQVFIGGSLLDRNISDSDLMVQQTNPPIRLFLGRCSAILIGSILTTFAFASGSKLFGMCIKNLSCEDRIKQRYFWWFYQHFPYAVTSWFQ